MYYNIIEVNMERRFLILSLLLLLAMPSFAELTVDDTVSKDYLMNHGYSTASVNAIKKSVAEVNGEALQEPVERKYYKNPCVKFVRRIFMYVDPSLDDHSFMNDHEIKFTPRYDDL